MAHAWAFCRPLRLGASAAGSDPARGLRRSDLAGFGVIKGDPLERLRLRRIAMDRLRHRLERQFMGDRRGQFADHFAGMRRHKRRSDNLAAAAMRINRREAFLLSVDKRPLHLVEFEPVDIDRHALFMRLTRSQADLGDFRVRIGAMRDDEVPSPAIGSLQRIGDA